MATTRSDSEREQEAIARESRANPEAFVYCKGCGTPLESRARLSKPRPVVDTMMCDECQQIHHHPLMPSPGAPTYCYRCGRLEEVFIEPGTPSMTHHLCPHCLADRVARYRAGDFADPQPTSATGGSV